MNTKSPKINYLSVIPSALYIQLQWWKHMKRPLHLRHPCTFNEKLQWLKLNYHNPLYTQLADKYAVRSYIAERCGTDCLVPLLGVWKHFDDISFEELPDQFVLKCTHDSGSVVFCKDKTSFDRTAAKKTLEACLQRNYYYVAREWSYKDIPPRIIAEEYLGEETNDYKFICFSGQPKCIFTCTERYARSGLKVTFFDTKWNVLPFERHYHASSSTIAQPKNLDAMLEMAKTLSAGIPLARIDFYEIKGKTYLGEITLYPGSGYEEFTPDSWDLTLGNWLTLPAPIR